MAASNCKKDSNVKVAIFVLFVKKKHLTETNLADKSWIEEDMEILEGRIFLRKGSQG